MSTEPPFIRSILHPSDLSASSRHAFAHALATAVRNRTKLTVLHSRASPPDKKTWSSFPGIRDTLTRWGLLESGSPRTAVESKLGVHVDKVTVRSSNAASAILDYVESYETDLIVVATAARGGMARWLQPSVAEKTARDSRTMTLFIPDETRGFISPIDGTNRLHRILVPVDTKPRPDRAVRVASRAAESFGGQSVAIDLLHVGKRFPHFHASDDDRWDWEALTRPGDPVERIVETAAIRKSDLIVMVTEGHSSFLDAVRGNTTEQVLRKSPCPILAVPAR